MYTSASKVQQAKFEDRTKVFFFFCNTIFVFLKIRKNCSNEPPSIGNVFGISFDSFNQKTVTMKYLPEG